MTTAYHYCDLHAFLSIIENKKLWLSSVENMNDTTDSKWVIHNLKEKVRGTDLEGQVNNIIKNSGKQNIYTCCFSTKGDVLSQWARYAKDGEGVSIGFDLESFNEEKNHSTQFTEIKYTSINDELINEKIGHFIENLNHLNQKNQTKIHELSLKGCEASEIGEENIIESFSSKCGKKKCNNCKNNDLLDELEKLRSLDTQHKNSAFREEEEIRIIYIYSDILKSMRFSYDPDSKEYFQIKDIGEMKHRVSGKTITSYFELDFSKDKKGKDIDSPIKEIIIGPKCEMTKAQIRRLLINSGFDSSKIKIKHSEATYR